MVGKENVVQQVYINPIFPQDHFKTNLKTNLKHSMGYIGPRYSFWKTIWENTLANKLMNPNKENQNGENSKINWW